jgi:hypothetical protein
MKKKLTYYLAMALLHSCKPFLAIGNWLWRMHRVVLDWNKD